MFSHRTSWHRQHNKLSEALETRKRSGKSIYDLTISNPTQSGVVYPEQEILRALANPKSLHYQPDPRGLLSAREAVSAYYQERAVSVSPADVFLTSSTSEAYSVVFKLLCNADENVLVPTPSYPLFEYLAQLNDVKLQYYHLRYDGEWNVDIDSLRRAVTSETRAIVLIHPHNPTGMFLKKMEFDSIKTLAQKHNLALIVDEVFIDYAFEDDARRIQSTASGSDVLTFTLNGISKLAGLPQMKLGWITVGGPNPLREEAIDRLEIILDAFLSVNTSVQLALPKFFEISNSVRASILGRVKSNYGFLQKALINTPYSLLSSEGGWYGVIRMSRTKSDEEWALELLDQHGIYLHPGYFFDFDEEGCLVVSLLTAGKVFQFAIEKLAESSDR